MHLDAQYCSVPKCNILHNYVPNIGIRINENGYSYSLNDIKLTCDFLYNYNKPPLNDDPLYMITDFYPLCTFVNTYHDETSDKYDEDKTPKDYCIEFSINLLPPAGYWISRGYK